MKAVLDIGKTNVKLHIVNDDRQLVANFSHKNIPLTASNYPHADVSGIWSWLTGILRDFSRVKEITSFVVITHGATAVLIDTNNSVDGLVLPILDYEFVGVTSNDNEYKKFQPNFSETLSPDLPAGLNLGRQLFWQKLNFPLEFSRATHILMYPQYWAWRLTNKLASEVTSLGCHTDLWDPVNKNYSSLVTHNNWEKLMPPLRFAWEQLGNVTAEVAVQTGLQALCSVYVGMHDSNASYVRYLHSSPSSEGFTVISSGTWTVLMQASSDLNTLHEHHDMLAMVDVYGAPVACARFMGGREYDAICQELGGNICDAVDPKSIQNAVDNFWMVTPEFSAGNGPFAGATPIISSPKPTTSAAAIATLYYALMVDLRLTDIGSRGRIYIEGSILNNPMLCRLIAQLRPEQEIFLSEDDTGTVQGALLLTSSASATTLDATHCFSAGFTGIPRYKERWLEMVQGQRMGAPS